MHQGTERLTMSEALNSLLEKAGFPPVIGIDGLSVLLNKKPTVITIDRCRRPHTLPPACTPPETQKPLWITQDVIEWLRQYKEQPPKPKPKLGAPKKAERIAKRAAMQNGAGLGGDHER